MTIAPPFDMTEALRKKPEDMTVQNATGATSTIKPPLQSPTGTQLQPPQTAAPAPPNPQLTETNPKAPAPAAPQPTGGNVAPTAAGGSSFAPPPKPTDGAGVGGAGAPMPTSNTQVRPPISPVLKAPEQQQPQQQPAGNPNGATYRADRTGRVDPTGQTDYYGRPKGDPFSGISPEKEDELRKLGSSIYDINVAQNQGKAGGGSTYIRDEGDYDGDWQYTGHGTKAAQWYNSKTKQTVMGDREATRGQLANAPMPITQATDAYGNPVNHEPWSADAARKLGFDVPEPKELPVDLQKKNLESSGRGWAEVNGKIIPLDEWNAQAGQYGKGGGGAPAPAAPQGGGASGPAPMSPPPASPGGSPVRPGAPAAPGAAPTPVGGGGNSAPITGTEAPRSINPTRSEGLNQQLGALQQEALRQLQNPSAYDDELFKKSLEQGKNELNEYYGALKGDMDAELAGRGLSWSSTYGGRLSDLKTAQSRAMADRETNLQRDRAASIGGARAAAFNNASGIAGMLSGLESSERGEMRGERGYTDNLRRQARGDALEELLLGEDLIDRYRGRGMQDVEFGNRQQDRSRSQRMEDVEFGNRQQDRLRSQGIEDLLLNEDLYGRRENEYGRYLDRALSTGYMPYGSSSQLGQAASMAGQNAADQNAQLAALAQLAMQFLGGGR